MQTQQPASSRQAASSHPVPDYLLSRRQLILLAALGIFFWFVFALFVRVGNTFGLFGGIAGIATFLLSIVAGWLLVLLLQRLASLTASQLVPGIAMSTAFAALCDGVAFTWAPWLYGDDPAKVLLGAAYILWGAGVLIIVAYLLAMRGQENRTA